MQPPRDRQSGRFLTSLLAFALAVFTLVAPARVAAANPHACCAHMATPCPQATLQCCLPAPSRPTQAPPPQVSSAPAPDLAPLLPIASAPPPSLENLVLLIAGTPPVGAPPPLYLLHASLLV